MPGVSDVSPKEILPNEARQSFWFPVYHNYFRLSTALREQFGSGAESEHHQKMVPQHFEGRRIVKAQAIDEDKAVCYQSAPHYAA